MTDLIIICVSLLTGLWMGYCWGVVDERERHVKKVSHEDDVHLGNPFDTSKCSPPDDDTQKSPLP